MTTTTDRKVRVHVQMARRRIRQAAGLYAYVERENAAMLECPDITDDDRARATSARLVAGAVRDCLMACASSLRLAGKGEAELRWYEMGAVMAAQRCNDALGFGFALTSAHASRLLSDANDRLNYAAVLAEARDIF